MLKLIRNCSHKNETAVFYFEKKQDKCIVKASSSQAGIEDIKQEVKGWRWYSSKRYADSKRELCKIVQSRENYIRINIQYIDGSKEKYVNGIKRNAGLINNIVKHYCDIWRVEEGNNPPLHGDLSIDNVIVNKDGVHIIDWEHFSLDGAPFGFDAYNLLFEQLWFSMKGRKKPERKELNILRDNIRTIRASSGESSYFYDQPLFSVQKFIRTNHMLWKDQFYRLPVLLFNEEKVMIVDKMIREYI